LLSMNLPVAVVFAVLLALPAIATAEVQFDGKTWYLLEKPESLQVNAQGYLEWMEPGPPQLLIVRLPEKQLSKPGDIVEIRYLYKAEAQLPTGCCSSRQSQSGGLSEISGTANFLIGLFDSKGKNYVSRDGRGSSKGIGKGYLGYYAWVFPHIPESFKKVREDGQVELPGRMMKRGAPESPSLLEISDGCRDIGPGISGFGAPFGWFVPLILRLKRTGANTVNFAVTIDNVTYHRFDEDAANQPRKIDTLGIYFPTARTCKKLTLAPMSAAKPPLRPASMRHVIVYREPGRFGGWPANNGAWSWGNEIVVAFARGWYKPSYTSHSMDWSKPVRMVQARSLDGGETWTIEEPRKISIEKDQAGSETGLINFAHPDLAIRVSGSRFFVSYDRARTWQGPYRFNGLNLSLSSRTDYIVEGPKRCLFFLSSPQPEVNGSNHSDRAFMARTTDGGRSFEFVAWLTGEPIKARSVMPSTVRTSPSRLVSITRRKIRNFAARKYTNWIEASVSEDNGATWSFLSKVAYTDRGEENGNPPALVRLSDGRLVVAYGYRSYPLGIRAKISEDGGKSWSDEIVLRDDGLTWDLGYPRMVVRPDGKLVTLYYYNNRQYPEPHIEATIWDPDTVRVAVP